MPQTATESTYLPLCKGGSDDEWRLDMGKKMLQSPDMPPSDPSERHQMIALMRAYHMGQLSPEQTMAVHRTLTKDDHEPGDAAGILEMGKHRHAYYMALLQCVAPGAFDKALEPKEQAKKLVEGAKAFAREKRAQGWTRDDAARSLKNMLESPTGDDTMGGAKD